MTHIDRTRWRGRILRYAPLLFWVGVIFYLSSVAGAMTETSRFVRPILRWLLPGTPENILEIYHGYIRKSAHFIEYAVLAFLAVRALSRSSIEVFRKHCYLFPVLLVAVIASLDEFNQSFLAERTGTISDVLLDLSGGIFAVAVMWLLHRIWPPRVDARPFTVSN